MKALSNGKCPEGYHYVKGHYSKSKYGKRFYVEPGCAKDSVVGKNSGKRRTHNNSTGNSSDRRISSNKGTVKGGPQRSKRNNNERYRYD